MKQHIPYRWKKFRLEVYQLKDYRLKVFICDFVKKSENQHFCRKIFFGISNKFVPNFYHFVTNSRHITSFMILKSNQGVSKTYQLQGMSGGSWNGHGWNCG
jgi:hypothetical protein